MTDRGEEPLPHVPVVLLCAEDDDLELVSFVHLARQYGLEPEVVPGVENGDRPLSRALADNEAALFVVLRSDNLTGERTLALKRAFNEGHKPGQHLLALRLDPERSKIAVKTIARRLRQLVQMPTAPHPSARPTRPRAPVPPPPPMTRGKPRVETPKKAETAAAKEPEVDEWAGTLVLDTKVDLEGTAGPSPPSPSEPSPTKTERSGGPPKTPRGADAPGANRDTMPKHTWTGTLIADGLEDPPSRPTPLADGDEDEWTGTLVADTSTTKRRPAPSTPPPAPDASTRRSEAHRGGTLVAEEVQDHDATLPQDIDVEESVPSMSGSGWFPAVPQAKSRRKAGLIAAVSVLLVAGGTSAAILAQGDDLVETKREAEPAPRPEPAAAAHDARPTPPTHTSKPAARVSHVVVDDDSDENDPRRRPRKKQPRHAADTEPEPATTTGQVETETETEAQPQPQPDPAEPVVPDEAAPPEQDQDAAPADAPVEKEAEERPGVGATSAEAPAEIPPDPSPEATPAPRADRP